MNSLALHSGQWLLSFSSVYAVRLFVSELFDFHNGYAEDMHNNSYDPVSGYPDTLSSFLARYPPTILTWLETAWSERTARLEAERALQSERAARRETEQALQTVRSELEAAEQSIDRLEEDLLSSNRLNNDIDSSLAAAREEVRTLQAVASVRDDGADPNSLVAVTTDLQQRLHRQSTDLQASRTLVRVQESTISSLRRQLQGLTSQDSSQGSLRVREVEAQANVAVRHAEVQVNVPVDESQELQSLRLEVSSLRFSDTTRRGVNASLQRERDDLAGALRRVCPATYASFRNRFREAYPPTSDDDVGPAGLSANALAHVHDRSFGRPSSSRGERTSGLPAPLSLSVRGPSSSHPQGQSSRSRPPTPHPGPISSVPAEGERVDRSRLSLSISRSSASSISRGIPRLSQASHQPVRSGQPSVADDSRFLRPPGSGAFAPSSISGPGTSSRGATSTQHHERRHTTRPSTERREGSQSARPSTDQREGPHMVRPTADHSRGVSSSSSPPASWHPLLESQSRSYSSTSRRRSRRSIPSRRVGAPYFEVESHQPPADFRPRSSSGRNDSLLEPGSSGDVPSSTTPYRHRSHKKSSHRHRHKSSSDKKDKKKTSRSARSRSPEGSKRKPSRRDHSDDDDPGPQQGALPVGGPVQGRQLVRPV
jgi:hypothetical protein